jgi:hypothetical protein
VALGGEKCCNKFKKPIGDPSNLKRGIIMRCQRIYQRILVKMSSEVMGLDSGGDDGLDLEEKEAERKMLNRRET